MYSIAKLKQKENISEYLLFLWQMEDLLRGIDFDLEKLDAEILPAIKDEAERLKTRSWLAGMAKDMEQESLQVSGHHYETYEVLNELGMLQQTLLNVTNSPSFIKAYQSAQPVLEDFRKKGEKVPKTDIETALTALYGVLTLRIAKKEVSEETSKAMMPISAYLRELTRAYHLMKAGKPF
ncbi:MAG TPA: DUF4924 family protein [Cryomorphaceae bacterium]|nr:DUF4924 family protein [Cryomorphaceae bacterium]